MYTGCPRTFPTWALFLKSATASTTSVLLEYLEKKFLNGNVKLFHMSVAEVTYSPHNHEITPRILTKRHLRLRTVAKEAHINPVANAWRFQADTFYILPPASSLAIYLRITLYGKE